MRTRRTIPIATALLAVIGGAAIGGEPQLRTADDGQDARAEREIRAANMADGRTYDRAAKADVRGAERTDVGPHGSVAMASTDHIWRDRAGWMMDRKDYDETAKADIDHEQLHEDRPVAASIGAEHELERRLPEGHDQMRAASLHDAKTGYVKAGPVQAADEAVADADATYGTEPVAYDDRSYRLEPASAEIDEPVMGESLALSQLPDAVRSTIQREAGDGAVLGVDGDEEYGRAVYTARISRAEADPLTLKVAEDGAVVWRDDLLERAEGSSSGVVIDD